MAHRQILNFFERLIPPKIARLTLRWFYARLSPPAPHAAAKSSGSQSFSNKNRLKREPLDADRSLIAKPFVIQQVSTPSGDRAPNSGKVKVLEKKQ